MLESTSSERKPHKNAALLRLKKRKIFFVSFVLLFFFFILCLVTFIFLARKGAFLVLDIESKDTTPLSEALKEEIRLALSQQRTAFFPRDTLLTLRKMSLESTLKNKYSQLDSLTLRRSFPHSLIIESSEREPYFHTPDNQMIDKNGALFREDVPSLYRGIEVPLLVASNTLSSEDISRLASLSSKMSTRLSPPSEVRTDENNDVFFILPEGTEIRFSLKADFDEVWTRLLSALDTAPLKSYLTDRQSLLYIDARFGNKVYYKKSTTTPAVTQSHHESSTSTQGILEEAH